MCHSNDADGIMTLMTVGETQESGPPGAEGLHNGRQAVGLCVGDPGGPLAGGERQAARQARPEVGAHLPRARRNQKTLVIHALNDDGSPLR